MAVHQKLASYRSTGEFFEVPIGIAVDAMDEAAAMYPINRDLGSRKRGGWGDEWLPQAFSHSIGSCPNYGQKNKIRSLTVSYRPKCGRCGGRLLS